MTDFEDLRILALDRDFLLQIEKRFLALDREKWKKLEDG